MSYPTTWPGTAIAKSSHNAFAWQDQPSLIPRESQQGKRGPKPVVKTQSGTIPGLSKKADKYQKTHGLSGHIVRPANHGGAYSKAAKGGSA